MTNQRTYIAVALLAAGLFSQNSFGQTYQVEDLGALPGKKSSAPAAINDLGQAAGSSSSDLTDPSAFRYEGPNTKLPMTDLGQAVADSVSRGFGMNNAGLVVGDSNFGEGEFVRRAAVFHPKTTIDLVGAESAGYSRANDVNSFEQVVGNVTEEFDGLVGRAFIWSQTTGMRDLGTLGGNSAQALAINDAGLVTGNAQTAKGEDHAFLYQPNSRRTSAAMRDLGTLGGSSSYGMAINSHNHVVGYSSINSKDNIHAFLSDGVTMKDLGSLGGKSIAADHSVALGVNDRDEVVGYSYLAPEYQSDSPIGLLPVQTGFIYRDGAMIDLNTLIGDASKVYRIHSALAINAKGQIVASAFNNESNAFCAVLLTPQ